MVVRFSSKLFLVLWTAMILRADCHASGCINRSVRFMVSLERYWAWGRVCPWLTSEPHHIQREPNMTQEKICPTLTCIESPIDPHT